MSYVVYAQYREPQPIPSGGNTATATHAAATLTYAAPGDGVGYVLPGIVVSYAGTVTGGNVTVQDGAMTVLDVDLLVGTWPIIFPMPILCQGNAPLTITLTDGGASVVGKINALGVDTQPSGSWGVMDFSINTNSGLVAAVI